MSASEANGVVCTTNNDIYSLAQEHDGVTNYIYYNLDVNDDNISKESKTAKVVQLGKQCSASCNACSKKKQLILGGNIDDPEQVANREAQKQIEEECKGLQVDTTVTLSSLEKRDMINIGFSLQEVIAEGQYARVYNGQVKSYTNLPSQSQLGNYLTKQCTVKALSKDIAASSFSVDKETASRFISRELAITQGAQGHRNIVKYIEKHETLSHFYLFIEKCKSDLNTHILENKKLKEEEARKFFIQIVEGVKHLHRKGIVHRDLKCENILLDFNHNVKISDFGLAAVTPNKRCKLLKTGCGSLSYAAPELLNEEKYDGRLVDIWAIGVILYAMVNGCTPWQCEKRDILLADMHMQRIRFAANSSAEFRVLIRGILVWDPLKRLSLSDMLYHPWTCGEKFIPGERLYPGKGRSPRKEKSHTELILPRPRTLYNSERNNITYSTVSFQKGNSNITLKSRVPDHTKKKYLVGLDTPAAIRHKLQQALRQNQPFYVDQIDPIKIRRRLTRMDLENRTETRMSEVIGSLVKGAEGHNDIDSQYDDAPPNSHISSRYGTPRQSLPQSVSSAPCFNMVTRGQQVTLNPSPRGSKTSAKKTDEKEDVFLETEDISATDALYEDLTLSQAAIACISEEELLDTHKMNAEKNEEAEAEIQDDEHCCTNDEEAETEKCECRKQNVNNNKKENTHDVLESNYKNYCKNMQSKGIGGEQLLKKKKIVDGAHLKGIPLHTFERGDKCDQEKLIVREKNDGQIEIDHRQMMEYLKHDEHQLGTSLEQKKEISTTLSPRWPPVISPLLDVSEDPMEMPLSRNYSPLQEQDAAQRLMALKMAGLLDDEKPKVQHVTKYLLRDGCLSSTPSRDKAETTNTIIKRKRKKKTIEKASSCTSSLSSSKPTNRKESKTPKLPEKIAHYPKVENPQSEGKVEKLPNIHSKDNVTEVDTRSSSRCKRYAVTVQGVLVGATVEASEPDTPIVQEEVYRLPVNRKRRLRKTSREAIGLPVCTATSLRQTPSPLKNEQLVGLAMTRFDCLPGVYHGSDVYVPANRIDTPTMLYDLRGRLRTPLRNKPLKNAQSLMDSVVKKDSSLQCEHTHTASLEEISHMKIDKLATDVDNELETPLTSTDVLMLIDTLG